MNEYLKFFEENYFLFVILGFIFIYIAFVFYRRNRGINAAIMFEKMQHEVASSEVISEAREDATKEGCLSEFNNALSSKGTPITYFKVMLSHQEALKTVGKSTIDGV